MTEPRVAHKFEREFFGYVVQYAVVKRAYSVNKFLHKLFKQSVRRFVIGFVRVIPLAVVVGGKSRKIVHNGLRIHIFLLWGGV